MVWALPSPRGGKRGAAASRATRAAAVGGAGVEADYEGAGGTATAPTPQLDGSLDEQFAQLSVARGAPARGGPLAKAAPLARGGPEDRAEGRRREAVSSPSVAPGSEDRANPRKTRAPQAPFRRESPPGC